MITVELENLGGKSGVRVVLRFPYSEAGVARAKSVSGGRWSREFRCWHYPVDLTVCKLLREAFPDLTIGPRLTSWARTEKARQASLGQFHAATSAEPVDLPVVRTTAPTMWAAMQDRGYQTLIPAFSKEVGNYFNGSQPGTGKTIETLATLVEREVGQRILIIAPKKAIQSTWPREVHKWLAPDFDVNVLVCDDEQGSMAEREALLAEFASAGESAARFEFVLINPEMLRWEFNCPAPKCNGLKKTCAQRSAHTKSPLYPSLFQIEWDAVIMDETHKIMMNANERSANVSGWGYGAQKINTSARSLKIGLSGTPFKGKPRRFWTMLHWLNPEKYTGRDKWERTYFEVEADRYAYNGSKVTDVMRKDREQMFNDDLSSVMIRHTKRELRALNPAWAPPEKIHVEVRMPMTSKQSKAYQMMLDDASARLADGQIDANGILAERTRLKQFASAYASVRDGFTPTLPSNKWDWLKEALEERGLAKGMNDGSVKIVIASQYVKLLQCFSRELDTLGINHFCIYGPTRNVNEIEEAWQSDQTDTRVLLLSTHAGGVSLTLDAADDLVMVDEPDDPDTIEQVEDRVHRTSRTDHQVTIYHLISEGTIDESIASGNLAMDISQKQVLDGRRGVETARLTLEGRKAS